MSLVYWNYQKGLQFRHQSRDWCEEQKRRSVLEALRRAVRLAASDTLYYKNVFRDIGFDPEDDFSFDDFGKLPILDREDVSKAGESLVSVSVPEHQRIKDATGGTTGTPTEIWLGPEERGWTESGIQFSFEKLGVQPGSKMAYLWGHHLDPQAGDGFWERFRGFAANVRYFDCFRLSEETFEHYHEEFERFAPDCIVAYATALGHYAEYLRERRIRPRNYPRVCFVTGAEKLYQQHREAVEEVFGASVPVHERYGGRDFGPVAMQTDPASSLNFEVDWAWGLIEPETDEKYSPVLVTKLHADAMPMLRYRVGDLGEFPMGSKAGNPAFALGEIRGRQLDRIWLPNGGWVAGAEFPHLLKSFSVKEFMFAQDEDYSVELQIVPKADFDEGQRLEILRVVAANLENVPVKLSLVERVARSQANKWRPVVTKVKRA